MSRKKSLKDWVLFGLLLNPFRCNQCMRRFFRFRSRWAQRSMTMTLFLLPIVVLAAWFIGLRTLEKVRAVPPVEPSKPQTMAPINVQQLLNNR
jgi:hypothetical protein